MKKIILLFLLLPISIFVRSQQQAVLKLYVGTFTSEGAEGIYLCSFNNETGDVGLEKTFKALDDPSFLKISPDKKYVYVVGRANDKVEKSGGFVSAYKINKDRSLLFLNKQVSNGSDPCYVDVSPDGRFVAIATYGSGTISLYPVENDGKLLSATSIIENKGSGPDKSRQVSPHAHSVRFSPFSGEVFSADLGTDQLNMYSLDKNNLTLTGQNFVKLPAGSGPRHFEFHPQGNVIYVINELNSTISVLKQEKGVWAVVQNISTLPSGFNGKSYCADIHLSKDGRFLYGSNRGDNSIAVFKIEQNSMLLTAAGLVSTEGDWPRNFTLSPDGRFMLVANQRSGNITIFALNDESGIPVFTGKEIKLPSPVCLEFLE